MDFNRWWDGQSGEIYWLEVTDRKDLGADLNAPQRRDDGDEYYGYSLIQEVRDGDVVFHYHKDRRAIVAWSVATGSVWPDEVEWGAHGTVARSAGVRPYVRPGWRLGLNGTQPLEHVVTLEDLRRWQGAMQAVREALEVRYGKPVYFPFEPPEKRDLRPTQAYLTKLPAGILGLFPSLSSAAHEASRLRAGGERQAGARERPEGRELGAPYRPADEEVAVSERDPFSVDPALVERANRGHAATQNILAAYLRQQGIEPRSPVPGEPNYDLAWMCAGTTYVAEVKSLTTENEEKQMRLGLGQVLRYRHVLRDGHGHAEAVIMLERGPTDTGWEGLCNELGIKLIWPNVLARLLT